MKLSFSTLGCPNWSFEDIFSVAKDLKYDGIEIRGIGSEIYAPRLKIFNDFNIDSTVEKFRSSGMQISMFTTGAVIGKEETAQAAKKEAFEYINLAYKSDVRYIRIMISDRPEADEVNLELAKEVYAEICEYAKEKNVCPLIETNGVLSDSNIMKNFMESVKSPNKGILWDLHHPYRYMGEKEDLTFGNIGEYVKYMHIKDSVMSDGKVSYRMVGHGDIPILNAVKLLKKHGYTGYLTLEWTKRWCPELQESGIVFSHYINFMHSIFSELE